MACQWFTGINGWQAWQKAENVGALVGDWRCSDVIQLFLLVGSWRSWPI